MQTVFLPIAGIVAVMALFILPGPLVGLAIKRSRERAARTAVRSTPSPVESDPLPPSLMEALHVDGFLNDEEFQKARARRQLQAELDQVVSDCKAKLSGATDAVGVRLVGRSRWVELNASAGGSV